MRSLISLALVPLLACSTLPEEVKLQGTVRDAVSEEAGAFSGARIEFFDEAAKRSVGKADTDSDGEFQANVPAGERFHMLISGEGHVTTSFTGVSGLQDKFRVEDGLLHGMTQAEWDDWSTRFAGCPGVAEGSGGAVFGEPRIQELVDENGVHPGVNAAIAELWDAKTEKVVHTACYLGEDGELYDEAATMTGVGGVFAMYGVEPGVYVLSVGLEVFEGSFTWHDSVVYVPEGGVAPHFPAWVHFPL